MKIIIIIFILNIVLFCQTNVFAKDTLALVTVENAYFVDDSTLEFQLRIQRTSDKWLKFVNGTFQFQFPPNTNLLPADYEMQFFGSDLPEDVSSGAILPKKEYLIETQKFDERFSITILGPENYVDCVEIPTDTSILLAQYRIVNVNGGLVPGKFQWLEPQEYFQAAAYKIEYDSVSSNITWYYANDNVEMHDEQNNTFAVKYNDGDPWQFELEDFWVRYKGQLNYHYGWSTRREIKVLGYTILYGYKLDGEEVDFSDTLGTFLPGEFNNPGYKSQGTSPTGFVYGAFDDVAPYRGGVYAFALWGRFRNSDNSLYDSLLAVRTMPVPHAVIVSATASPNPFSYQTTVTYEVEDDVYLSAYVTDLLGRRLRFLVDPETGQVLDRAFVPMGVHKTDFNTPFMESQGFYNIILIAYPINDPTVEISRAVVKVQHVKE